ncbi:hypothetical protein LTR22_026933 [Elasticomyces elasticus]|nr:hypothetical protein LTR22_026933 [Elasticomyces elasticus]KAK5756327.1 hypothetical protein LTS12_013516 [Elasticomyces elasticus]
MKRATLRLCLGSAEKTKHTMSKNTIPREYLRELCQYWTALSSRLGKRPKSLSIEAAAEPKETELMGLPAEIRLIIAGFLFDDGSPRTHQLRLAKKGRYSPIHPVLRTCKLVRQEMMPVFWSLRTIWMEDSEELLRAVQKPPEHMKLWESLHVERFETLVFGARGRLAAEYDFKVLARLPGLHRLSVRISEREVYDGGKEVASALRRVQLCIREALPVLVKLQTLEITCDVTVIWRARQSSKRSRYRLLVEKTNGVWMVDADNGNQVWSWAEEEVRSWQE